MLTFVQRTVERTNEKQIKVTHRRQEEMRGVGSDVGIRLLNVYLLTVLIFQLCKYIICFLNKSWGIQKQKEGGRVQKTE